MPLKACYKFLSHDTVFRNFSSGHTAMSFPSATSWPGWSLPCVVQFICICIKPTGIGSCAGQDALQREDLPAYIAAIHKLKAAHACLQAACDQAESIADKPMVFRGGLSPQGYQGSVRSGRWSACGSCGLRFTLMDSEALTEPCPECCHPAE